MNGNFSAVEQNATSEREFSSHSRATRCNTDATRCTLHGKKIPEVQRNATWVFRPRCTLHGNRRFFDCSELTWRKIPVRDWPWFWAQKLGLVDDLEKNSRSRWALVLGLKLGLVDGPGARGHNRAP